MKYITKSLFVEFCESPMLAWYHRNDKITYDYINEQQYGAMDAISIGQEVEDTVASLWQWKKILTVDTSDLDFKDWHGSYLRLSMQTLEQQPDIVYQPWFVSDDLFCKVDFLVRNAEWTYDIVEVKSKSSIRKKTKKAPLLEDLEADISFQDMVVRNVLGDLYSGKVSIAYLNKEYTKEWDIDPRQLVIIEDVTDDVLDTDTTQNIVDGIQRNIWHSKADFQSIYSYNGEYPLLYFWEKPKQWSIFTIPRITSSKRKLLELYDAGIRTITNLDQNDIELLSGWKPDSKFVKFVELYHQGKTIDKEGITDLFKQILQYPLYFYDYETVTVPVPLFEHSTPRQQVIVQYSLHKIDADGTVTHYEWLLENGETDNKRVIDKLIQDLTQTPNGTYIVRYKWFENSRNTEAWKMYPEYIEQFEHINNNTFDLMDVFKDLLYFDPAFCGSSSIKKVLPVLTDISYSDLSIGNWWQAADALGKLAKKTFTNEEAEKVKKDLLQYCRQDTRAMVAIWQKVCEEIGYEIPDLTWDVG